MAAAPSAQAATKNWVGPGCPRGWTCQGTATGTEASPVTQTATGAGSVNHANCTGPCYVVQQATGGAVNETICGQTANSQAPVTTTSQSCVITQTSDSGQNLIRVKQSVKIESENAASTNHDSSQQVSTDQTSSSGKNTVDLTGSISQRVESEVEVNVVSVQETLQLVHIKQQNTSGSNGASVNLSRQQVSNLEGTNPEQEQDVRMNDVDPSCLLASCPSDPNGLIQLDQENGTGDNSAKIRARDVKSESSVSFSGDSGQFQGHRGGGWLTPIKMNPSGTLDLGAPGGKDGLTKSWRQRALTADEVPVPAAHLTQSQLDPIRLPILGLSPDVTSSNEASTLVSGNGAFQECFIEASGDAHTSWTGALSCALRAGSSTQSKTVNIDAGPNEQVQADVNCTQGSGDLVATASDGSCSGSSGPPSS